MYYNVIHSIAGVNMSITSVRLQPEVEQGLEAMAASQERSKSWLINQAVKEYIERQTQEKTRWQETLIAMDSVVKGQVVSGDAVHAWLESWGKENEQPPPKIGQ
jgi:predicted transcriptional regulator